MQQVPESAIWVRFPRFFGDAMMIHAAIAPLRGAGLPLVAWGPAWVLDLVEGSSGYVACVADRERHYGIREAARMLRDCRPSALVNFTKSHRSMLASWLARVPLRVGCGDGGASFFYTHSVTFRRQQTAFVERYASVVRRAYPELPPVPFSPFSPRAEALETARRRRLELGIGPYIVLAPGANCWNKRIPTGTLAGIGRIASGAGLETVILGGQGEDQQLAREILDRFPEAHDLTASGGLAVSAAWICDSQGLVGGDSGLTHVAGATGIPTLAVFGPTRMKQSTPWGPRVKACSAGPLDCLGCMKFDCPVGNHPCMRDLRAPDLFEALVSLF